MKGGNFEIRYVLLWHRRDLIVFMMQLKSRLRTVCQRYEQSTWWETYLSCTSDMGRISFEHICGIAFDGNELNTIQISEYSCQPPSLLGMNVVETWINVSVRDVCLRGTKTKIEFEKPASRRDDEEYIPVDSVLLCR